MTFDVHTEDAQRMLVGFMGVVGQFDTPGLASSTYLYLGFHNDLPADFLSRSLRLRRRGRHPSFGHRNPDASEQRFPLVFE
jgi:hypothetical protein